MRIFILDNEIMVAKMIGSYLETENIDFDMATNSEEANNFLYVDYDWIICDYFLDGKETGLDFAKKYKTLHKNSKVLIYSAKFDDIDTEIIDKVIYKSVKADDLMRFFKENIFKNNVYNSNEQYFIIELKKDVDYLKTRDCTNSMIINDHDKKIALFEIKQKDFQEHLSGMAGKIDHLEKKVEDSFKSLSDELTDFRTQHSNDKVSTILWVAGIFFTMLCGFIGIIYELVKGLIK